MDNIRVAFIIVLLVFFSSCFLFKEQSPNNDIKYYKLSNGYQNFLRTEDSSFLINELPLVERIIALPSTEISDSACLFIPTYLLYAHKYNDLIMFLEKKQCGEYDKMQINLAKHILSEQAGDSSNYYMIQNINIIDSIMKSRPADSTLLFDYYLCLIYMRGTDSVEMEISELIKSKGTDTREFYNSILEIIIARYNQNPDSTR